VSMMWTGTLLEVIEDLKMNYSRVVHGQEGYEYFHEIYPGDILTGKLKVTGIKEKSGQSGIMDIVTLETIYTNQREEKVVKAVTVLVERK
ncbi:MAG: MaoC family dehydratase N-terminal domain-containing protein, partial [Desulfosarcina sp.]|nr:MaoC family dehydratase N-terminal domain-containing protein [Desulfobacterales bacterium]